jgi:hypothetical protein
LSIININVNFIFVARTKINNLQEKKKTKERASQSTCWPSLINIYIYIYIYEYIWDTVKSIFKSLRFSCDDFIVTKLTTNLIYDCMKIIKLIKNSFYFHNQNLIYLAYLRINHNNMFLLFYLSIYFFLLRVKSLFST